MAFDKNKDGKVTKDELPERMHHLIDLGDTNKDGASTRTRSGSWRPSWRAAPGEFVGRCRVVGISDSRCCQEVFAVLVLVPLLVPVRIEGVVNDLKLSGKKKELAMAAAKAHQEYVRKLMDQARA